MLSQLSIPKKRKAQSESPAAALDYELLFVAGLEHVERLARRVWNDYNVHDPGITTLELLCYAITDLSYRASHPIADLLATAEDNAENMAAQFFTARKILPNRALTVSDYRKLLIDLEGVQNAWIWPASQTYYADTINGALLAAPPAGAPGIVDVNLAGLYTVVVEFTDDVAPGDRPAVLDSVTKRLAANRNLCEDFIGVSGVDTEEFVLCCELELMPDADVKEVHAQILFQVQEYLAPPVRRYTLSQMLERTAVDGTPYTVDRIFDGPTLDNGFITDEDLAASELRTEVRLSDIMSIIMDIPGVKAIRDIVISPSDSTLPFSNKWLIPVEAGKQALLDRDRWRLISYKSGMPFMPAAADVLDRWDELDAPPAVGDIENDLEIPLGTFRDPRGYYSFQNHYPVVYGISDVGLGSAADSERKARAYQLKGYLLFFDQIMADYLAQLGHVADLFSTDPGLERTYFHQVVDSFRDYRAIYADADTVVATLEDDVDDAAVLVERRNRFLDHLISRFAERFHDFVHIMHNEFGFDAASMIDYKCRFLASYPEISGGRSMAYNDTLAGVADLWDSDNISGLEKRLAALLGIEDSSRRDLTGDEGMYLIENILLRPAEPGDPFLPICPDPNCTECFDEDPYSYRIHIVLPGYGPRFGDIEFRRWAERTIREETPAHIQPKVCWISSDDMAEFQTLYRDWIYLKAGVDTTDRTQKLIDFIGELFRVKNIYPKNRLHECDSEEADTKFIIGKSALGTME